MSFFSAPASVPPKPEPTAGELDPSAKAQRDAIAAETRAENAKTGEAARRREQARTMGTEGANAYFTGGPAGYGRTMGSANI